MPLTQDSIEKQMYFKGTNDFDSSKKERIAFLDLQLQYDPKVDGMPFEGESSLRVFQVMKRIQLSYQLDFNLLT